MNQFHFLGRILGLTKAVKEGMKDLETKITGTQLLVGYEELVNWYGLAADCWKSNLRNVELEVPNIRKLRLISKSVFRR